MDALTRISYYYPTSSFTSFWILTNLIVNNQDECADQDRSLLIALLVIFSILVIVVSFTDTYTASNAQSYAVLIVPLYGPVCFSLPTVEDKDRVYDCYFLRVRDYVHAFTSLSAFIVTVNFLNPVANCLYPGEDDQGNGTGTAAMADSVIRTIPIVMGIITGLVMMCLGPPRQMLGLSNVPETCPAPMRQLENPMFDRPPYAGSRPPPSIPEGDEEYDTGPPPQLMPMSLQRQQPNDAGGAPHPDDFRPPRDGQNFGGGPPRLQHGPQAQDYTSFKEPPNMGRGHPKGSSISMSQSREREVSRQASGRGRDPSPGFRGPREGYE